MTTSPDSNAKPLVQRAREFATQAHRRIEHRRKYSKQAYEVHFKAHQEAVKHAEAFEKGCRENEVAHSISGIAAHQRDVQAHSAALSYPHSMAGRASAYGPAYGAGYHHGGYGRGFGVGYGQGYGHGVYR